MIYFFFNSSLIFLYIIQKMKKSNDFLQYESAQQYVKDLKPQGKLKQLKEFLLSGKGLHIYEENISKVKISFFFVLSSLSVLHTIIVSQKLACSDSQQCKQDVLSDFDDDLTISYILFAFLIVLKMAFIASVGLTFIIREEIVGLTRAAKAFIGSVIVIKQLDLVLSAFMTIINWKQNIILLFLASLQSIFQAIYLQNYVIRKEPFYIISIFDYLLFQSYVILIYFGNVIALALENQIGLHIYHCCFGLIHLAWYLRRGSNMFLCKFESSMFVVLNALFLTINTSSAERLFNEGFVLDTRQVSKLLLTFLGSILLFHVSKISKIQKIIGKTLQNPKQANILIKTSLEDAQNFQELECMMVGLLQMHQINQHHSDSILSKNDKNVNELQVINDGRTEQEFLYDPLLKMEIRKDFIYKQKNTAFMHYMKENYEKGIRLGMCPQKCIDYCQFLCNDFNHPYLALKYLVIAQSYTLDIFQLTQVSKMRDFIKKQCTKINKDVYGGRLYFEKVIQAQESIQIAQKMITNYIIKSQNIWESLKLKQIDISQLYRRAKFQQEYIRKIDQQWKWLSQFFRTNKYWLCIYTHYRILIKNEKLKQEDVQQFCVMPGNSDLMSSQKTNYYGENMPRQTLLDASIIFSRYSCYFTAKFEHGQLIFTKSSKNLVRITGYQEERLKGQPIDVLMEDRLAQTHKERVLSWLLEGRLMSEDSYTIPYTAFVGSLGKVIPALKYYKAHYHIKNGIEFVCLLNANLKDVIPSGKNQLNYLIPSNPSIGLANNQRILQQGSDRSIGSNILEANIFIKQDALQPATNLKQISAFKIISRIFLIVTILSIIAFSSIVKIDGGNLNSYVIQFFTFMSMYRLPVALGVNYMKKILNVGNMTLVNRLIEQSRENMLTTSAAQQIKVTLFDNDLNPERIYYPYYNYSFLANQNQTNIDLFYTIVSSISSIDQYNINRTGPEFQRFSSYLKPAYDNMMNTTKYRLHDTFALLFDQAVTRQTIFIAVQLVVFTVFAILLLYYSMGFIKRMKNILKILLGFDHHHLDKIISYWRQVRRYFKDLNKRLIIQGRPSSHTSMTAFTIACIQEQKKQEQVTLCKIQSNFTEGKYLKRLDLKLKLFVIPILLIVVILIGAIQLGIIGYFNQLQQLQLGGFFLIRYFPGGSLVTLGVVQKYYSLQYPQQIAFNPHKYDDVLGAIYLFGNNYDYIAESSDPNSDYYNKQKNYFFGNACEYNPSLLTSINISVQRCNRICNSSMKHGISSYLRYAYKLGSMYLADQISLSADELDEFTLGATIQSILILDAMSTWSNQFSSTVEYVETASFNSCLILLAVVLFLHFVICEFQVIGLFEQQYESIRKIYCCFVPQFLLLKEKVIRQKFINEGLFKH